MKEFRSISSVGELKASFLTVGFLIAKEQQGWKMFKEQQIDKHDGTHIYVEHSIDYDEIYKHSKVLLKTL